MFVGVLEGGKLVEEREDLAPVCDCIGCVDVTGGIFVLVGCGGEPSVVGFG